MEETRDQTKILIPTFEGRVVCFSCHDIHLEGVKRKHGGQGGNSFAKLLRTSDSWNLCGLCHAGIMN
jgi:hypothetical protein